MQDEKKELNPLPPDEESVSLTTEDNDHWGNDMLRPDKPLANRHREIARLAAHGKTQKYIAQKLNYTQGS